MKVLDYVDYLRLTEMPQLFEYRVFTDWSNYQVLLDCNAIGFDTETTVELKFDKKTKSTKFHYSDPKQHRLRLIQVYMPSIDEVAILDLWNLDSDKIQWLHILLKVLQDASVAKFVQNSLFDLAFFRVKFGIHVRNVIDTRLLSQVLKAGQYDAYKFDLDITYPNALEWLCKEYGYRHDKQYQDSDWSRLDLSQDQIDYAGRDAIVTYLIGSEMIEHNEIAIYQNETVQAELGAINAFVELNYRGMPVGDVNVFFRLVERYRQAALKAREDLSNLMPENPNRARQIEEYWKNPKYAKRQTGKKQRNPLTGEEACFIEVPKHEPFNVGSPAQVKEYLKQRFGAESVLKYDNATGEEVESTGKDVLFNLHTDYPEATELKGIVNFRGVDKASSTLESYWNSYDSFNESMNIAYQVMATQGMGRSSSGNRDRSDVQNAQNFAKYLPSHAAFKLPPVRSFVSARPGYSLLEIDLASSHMQFARMLSNDNSLQKAKRSGIKVHYFTLSSMLAFEGIIATPEECIDLVLGKADASRKDFYEYLYKLGKTVIFSFLNYSGAKRLKETFFKYEVFVKEDDCRKYLDACAEQYWKLRQFQDEVYGKVMSTLEDVYVLNRLDGQQLYLGKMGYSRTCDGSKVWHRAQAHQDYRGNWVHKIKISDAVSVQWMRPEGTVMKRVLGKIHQLCMDVWGLDMARLVNFSHDSLVIEIRNELLAEIAPKCCQIVDDSMRVYIPDYEPEDPWEKQILRHNWGKYDWSKDGVRLAG